MPNFDEDGNLMLQLKDSAGRPAGATGQAIYELIDDKYEGFARAVRNSQTILALEYAMHLIQDMANTMYYMNEDIKELKAGQSESEPVPAKKAVKRASKKAASTVKAEEDNNSDKEL